MKPYESELTQFMREYLAAHPEEIESQKIGRAVWWDKTPRTRGPLPAPVWLCAVATPCHDRAEPWRVVARAGLAVVRGPWPGASLGVPWNTEEELPPRQNGLGLSS